MKSLVIYDSKFGNTQLVAEAVAEVLGSEAKSVSGMPDLNKNKYELLVVGSPVNGWRPSENMGNFLARLGGGQLKGVVAATFDTRVKLFIHGDAMGKIAKSLKSAGAEIAIEPMPFYVKGTEGPLLEGEIEKAKVWAGKIKAAIE